MWVELRKTNWKNRKLRKDVSSPANKIAKDTSKRWSGGQSQYVRNQQKKRRLGSAVDDATSS
ncbi:hypothetical protein N7456_010243 [Penicillium angulare]|uniref:Uncharacterized protein n=1 Tax=Penicillium angulare TaxID=116970 RepID=A0A9W9K6W7_9EURO|nr:hypothetical protein N7456_010243 [Penicillium angulare]